MTRQEFTERYARLSGLSVAELAEYRQAHVCTCGQNDCGGWQMLTPASWADELELRPWLAAEDAARL